MDENTLQNYEKGVWEPTTRRAKKLIAQFLALPVGKLNVLVKTALRAEDG